MSVDQSVADLFVTNSSGGDNDTADGNGSHFYPLSELNEYIEFRISAVLNRHYLWCLLIIGATGNGLCFLVLRRRRMLMTSSTLYMQTLCWIDSLALFTRFLMMELPTQGVAMGWGCKVAFFAASISGFGSAWIVVTMTVDKVIAVWWPLKVATFCTVRKAKFYVIFNVLAIGLVNFHAFFTMDSEQLAVEHYRCRIAPKYQFFETHVLHYINSTLESFLPLSALLVLNTLIIIGLHRAHRIRQSLVKPTPLLRRRSQPPESSQQAAQEVTADAPARRPSAHRSSMSPHSQITIMLLTVSLAFIFLTAPLCIFHFVIPAWNKNYIHSAKQAAELYLIKDVCYFLADANHAVNFLLYALSARQFRREFVHMIVSATSCCRRKKQQQVPIIMVTFRSNLRASRQSTLRSGST